MSSFIFQNIRDFSLNSIQNFPFLMSISFLVLGVLFYQPTWSLVSLGVMMVYFVVVVCQTIFGKFLPMLGDNVVAMVSTPIQADSSCYPFSGTARPFIFPSEWMTQTAFILCFIMYNSLIVMKRKGNQSLVEAYMRRMSRTQISILASAVLLVAFMAIRYKTECDTGTSIILSTLMGWGLAVGYWHTLDICNTQLNSDVLGITRNMAPASDNPESAVVCTT